MSEMIDELVEIGARSDAEYDGRPFDGLGKADKERYLGRARKSVTAQLTRLRDPTPKMRRNGEYTYVMDDRTHAVDTATDIFRAMLDAVIEGPK